MNENTYIKYTVDLLFQGEKISYADQDTKI